MADDNPCKKAALTETHQEYRVCDYGEIEETREKPHVPLNESYVVTNRDLVDVFLKKQEQQKEISDCLEILNATLRDDLNEGEKKSIIQSVRNLKSTFKTKYSNSRRVKKRFLERNMKWLNNPFTIKKILRRGTVAITEERSASESSSTLDVGRPSKAWTDVCLRSQQRQASDLANTISQHSLRKVFKAAQLTAARNGDKELSNLLDYALKSPSRPKTIIKTIEEASKSNFQRYSPQEALALIIDEGLTVQTYKHLREGAKVRGIDLHPPYHEVLKVKQQSRPDEPVEVSDISAVIPVQNLLNHTMSRIFELQSEVLNQYFSLLKSEESRLTLYLSWGFDGSTGQSQYKQKFTGTAAERDADESLFATTVIPLQLKSDKGYVLWNNQTPQSIRYCRPLRLKFCKETADVIRHEKESVDQEIKNLLPAELYTNQNKRVTVGYDLSFTVIDGKVLSIVTGTSSQQSCPICGATPSQFNKILVNKFIPKPETLKYGISPLHAWIRCLEFCLHLGYRNCEGLKCWRVDGPMKKGIFQKRKLEIQEKLKRELALRVDFPKPGGSGSSNDGNTARRAFDKHNQRSFAHILGIELWLVEQLHVILVTISCGLPINGERFGQYCTELLLKYVETYGWYYMPVSLHKLLVHGKDIVNTATLPLVMLSEQAAESRNKLYR